jgi:hypothetical protein
MRTTLACAAALLLTTFAAAEDRKVTSAPRTNRICGVAWHDSVDRALKASSGKPVFVLRILGELDGFL